LIDNPRFAARVKHEAEVDAIITEYLRDDEALRAIQVRGYHFPTARSGIPSPS